MKKLSKNEVTKLVVEAQNILSAVQEYKVLYARLDEITEALKGQDTESHGFIVVDNFAEKNVVFKPVGVRRFELKKIA